MPPEAAAPEAPVAAPMDDMGSLSAAIHQSKEMQRPAPPQQPQKPEAPAAPEVAKTEPAAPKKPWETQVKDPNDPDQPEAPPAQESEPPDMKPEAKTRWKDLRATETQFKELKPKYEALLAENEALRNAPKEAPDDVKAELEELRAHRAAYDILNTKEYKEAVTIPFREAENRLREVADFAKVDYNKLYEACGENNKLARGKMISNLLQASEEEGVDAAVIAEATDAINTMIPLFAKDEELRGKAHEMRNALEGRKTRESEAQRQQSEATWTKSSKEMDSLLAPNFKALKVFEDPEFAKKVSDARLADPSKEPMEAVYQAKAGVMLPVIMAKYNELVAELVQAKKSLSARNGSSPTLSTTTSSPAEPPRKMNDTETLASLQAAARMPFAR